MDVQSLRTAYAAVMTSPSDESVESFKKLVTSAASELSLVMRHDFIYFRDRDGAFFVRAWRIQTVMTEMFGEEVGSVVAEALSTLFVKQGYKIAMTPASIW